MPPRQGRRCTSHRQCVAGELDKPWGQQRHELLAVTAGMFHNSQVNWTMDCKEDYHVVQAIQRHRGLMLGNHTFVSINDHQSLTHIFAGTVRPVLVAKPAQGRLARWDTFLRQYTFHTRHIPGAENMFCDLQSRNGCSTTVRLHAQLHLSDMAHDQNPPPPGQQSIIMPTNVPMPKKQRGRSRDLDVADNPLLPQQGWSTATRIAAAQTAARLQSPIFIDAVGEQLLTDARGRILLPPPAGDGASIIDTVIVATNRCSTPRRSVSP